jgi:hypothetical protein
MPHLLKGTVPLASDITISSSIHHAFVGCVYFTYGDILASVPCSVKLSAVESGICHVNFIGLFGQRDRSISRYRSSLILTPCPPCPPMFLCRYVVLFLILVLQSTFNLDRIVTAECVGGDF